MPDSSSTLLDLAQIQDILPHRPPILLLDRVIELGENRIVALKQLTSDAPFFAGHFPGHPIMPGVLLVEAMAQAAAVLALTKMPSQQTPVYLLAIESAKFRKFVVPGDLLRLEVAPLRRGTMFWKFFGTAWVAGKRVAEAQFLAATAR